ncbi:hypothetical protein [Streptomyces anandii]|uniref:hypothetical protein n=1 Tax=Streptomyces anandii TaxID=285454 RepID=UPI0037A7DACA
MSLPVIALIVSGASAAFTFCNMFLSYKGYKRARPKVEMEVSKSGLSGSTFYLSGRRPFTIWLNNTSVTAVAPRRLLVELKPNRWSRFRVYGQTVMQAEQLPAIPAMGETEFRFEVESKLLDALHDQGYHLFRLAVELPRRRRLRTRWWKVPKSPARPTGPVPVQLSFDDL